MIGYIYFTIFTEPVNLLFTFISRLDIWKRIVELKVLMGRLH